MADATSAPAPVLCTMLRRDRARSLVRTAFPRRRAQLIAVKTRDELQHTLTTQLIDAVILDGGVGDEVSAVLPLAEDFPSAPFFLITALLPTDAPMVARAIECGCADVLVEGVDDSATRVLLQQRGFTPRFDRALAEPPAVLGLESTLQRQVWRSLVRRAGRPVRTEQLAQEQGMSREHLSRSFAAGRAPTLKRVIDLVRVLAAAELAKNPGFDVRDVAAVLGFASSSHLSGTTQRLVGARASSLSRLRTVDLLERFLQQQEEAADAAVGETAVSEAPLA
ncbi:MAG: AraC family transcriptional regulator [Gemmatimonadaceae bacterium]|nr:AraC family transcriptional regulator [Gemmatimonadaceae bacterium]